MLRELSSKLLKLYNLGHDPSEPGFDIWAWNTWQPVIRNWHRWIGTHVLAEAGNPGSVLSVGCGCSPILGMFNCPVHGIDIDGFKLDYAYTHIRPKVRISLVGGDITKLYYPIGSFDCVVCSEVLEHIHPDSLGKAIDFVVRCTSPVGCVIVAFPNYESSVGRFMENLLHGSVHFDTRLGTLDMHFKRNSMARVGAPKRLFWDTIVKYCKEI